MLKHATLIGAAALALTIATETRAQTADTVVATVGGVDITLGEMIIVRAQLPQQYESLPDDVLWEGILDQIVQQQLLSTTTGEAPLRVELALRNERRALMAGEAINSLMAEPVTDEAIQAAYDARFAGAVAEPEYNASHLLVVTEEEALAAKARIDAGEEFADVAREVSTGPTGPNGGNLGWFGSGQMVAEFEEAVKGLAAGEVSGPVQTQFGWHIVKLNETRLQEQPQLEALREELIGEIRTDMIDGRIADLTSQVEIVMPEPDAFDPALLRNLDLLEPAAE